MTRYTDAVLMNIPAQNALIGYSTISRNTLWWITIYFPTHNIISELSKYHPLRCHIPKYLGIKQVNKVNHRATLVNNKIISRCLSQLST